MTIELTKRLAHVLMDVQDVLTKHGLEIDDPPCQAMWMELQKIAVDKANEDFHPRFNVVGCETGRFMQKFQKVI